MNTEQNKNLISLFIIKETKRWTNGTDGTMDLAN